MIYIQQLKSKRALTMASLLMVGLRDKDNAKAIGAVLSTMQDLYFPGTGEGQTPWEEQARALLAQEAQKVYAVKPSSQVPGWASAGLSQAAREQVKRTETAKAHAQSRLARTREAAKKARGG